MSQTLQRRTENEELCEKILQGKVKECVQLQLQTSYGAATSSFENSLATSHGQVAIELCVATAESDEYQFRNDKKKHTIAFKIFNIGHYYIDFTLQGYKNIFATGMDA